MSYPRVQEIEFFDGIWKVGYRVTTIDGKSLGLRRNPNIVDYEMYKWSYPVEEKVVEGISDEGGLWAARTIGAARAYQKYMFSHHQSQTRVFKSLLGRILFVNGQRIKTDKIFPIEELFLFPVLK
ncbi:hypothetical protein HNV12_04300 [Methanococcoides sp. SA1]|nr:hypothetical protein [Methanococcoides sp. SA1]